MSRYIATRALRGANLIVNEFDALLQKALGELGPDKEIKFTNTAYHLPTIRGYTGMEVEAIGQLKPVLAQCQLCQRYSASHFAASQDPERSTRVRVCRVRMVPIASALASPDIGCLS